MLLVTAIAVPAIVLLTKNTLTGGVEADHMVGRLGGAILVALFAFYIFLTVKAALDYRKTASDGPQRQICVLRSEVKCQATGPRSITVATAGRLGPSPPPVSQITSAPPCLAAGDLTRATLLVPREQAACSTKSLPKGNILRCSLVSEPYWLLL